jgi:hypothetical protein
LTGESLTHVLNLILRLHLPHHTNTILQQIRIRTRGLTSRRILHPQLNRAVGLPLEGRTFDTPCLQAFRSSGIETARRFSMIR